MNLYFPHQLHSTRPRTPTPERMSIPELLETLDREQDRQQLNVDLSFVGAGAGLADIRQRAQTGTGEDPAEGARNRARRACFDESGQISGAEQPVQPESA